MTTTNEQIAQMGPLAPLLAPFVALNNLLFPQKEEEKPRPLTSAEILRRRWSQQAESRNQAQLTSGWGGGSEIHPSGRQTLFF